MIYAHDNWLVQQVSTILSRGVIRFSKIGYQTIVVRRAKDWIIKCTLCNANVADKMDAFRLSLLLARLPELRRANIEHELIVSQVHQMMPRLKQETLRMGASSLWPISAGVGCVWADCVRACWWVVCVLLFSSVVCVASCTVTFFYLCIRPDKVFQRLRVALINWARSALCIMIVASMISIFCTLIVKFVILFVC